MRIDAEVYRIASDPEYMKYKGKSIGTSLRDINILGLRTYQGGTIPCFMARYGTQHMLDDTMLRSQGYHGHFAPHADFPEGCRYWHPAEIALMHGICKPTWLPDEYFVAWFGLGNQISIPHALLAIVNALARCFEPKLNLDQVLLDFASHQYGPQGLQFTPMAKGYMICPKDTQFQPGFLEAVTQIDAYLETNDSTFWSPKHGILDLFQAHWTLHSAVTPGSTSASEEAALEFQQLSPVFPGRIFFDDHSEDFWFSGKIPGDCIRAVWDSQFQCSFHDATQPIMLELHFQPLDFRPDLDNDSCVVSLMEHELTLLFCAPTALMGQAHIQNLGQDLFDQFGALDTKQQPAHDTLLLSTPLTFDDPQIDFVHLLGAFKQLQTQWNFATTTNILTCHLSGPFVSQEIWGKFWTSLLSPSVQQQLGRLATFDADQAAIYFRPQDKGVAPDAQFRLALAVVAVRTILDSVSSKTLPDEATVSVELRFRSRPLWSGLLPVGLTMDVIFSALQVGLGIRNQHGPRRLLHKGRQIMNELTIGMVANGLTEIKLYVASAMHGGGAKQQQKQVHQAALASTLLEQGFQLSWVTPTVDILVDKTTIQRLNSVTSMAMGHTKIQAIKQLCQDNGIDIPAPLKPQSGKSFPAAPWNKKPKAIKIDPAEFTLVSHYFLNADGTTAEQINCIRAQASGLCLMTLTQAMPWIQEGQTISSDELGILLVGATPITQLPHQEVTFPCRNADGAAVLLQGHLIQLGSKHITCKKDQHPQADADACQLMSVTLHMEDFDDDRWQQAVTGTAGFIRASLKEEKLDTALAALWGRSLRNGRAAASPHQATSIQMHCTIEKSQVSALLKISGFCKLFFTPKLPTGQLSQAYQLIWVGSDMVRAVAQSAQVAGCLGLVKGKNGSFALRFEKSAYGAAWKTLNPGIDQPQSTDTHKMYKIQGLPFGCSATMIQEWAKVSGWPCLPFRALGPQSWLVKAVAPPTSCDIMLFNGNPLLITPIQPRTAPARQVLLGPKSKQVVVPPGTDPLQTFDPWKKTSIPAPSTAPRQIDGPTEAKFKAQDDVIAKLQADLTQVSAKQEQFATHVETRFQAAEEREKQHAAQMQQSFAKMQESWDRSLQQTMQHHAKSMDQQFRDLKALFATSKRKNPADDEDDKMDS